MQTQPQFLHRDGFSQADRVQPALDPTYVSVDERSTKDLLAFAQKYAEELRYFNKHNEANETWRGFLGDTNLDEVIAYLNDPQRYQANPQKAEEFLRPHLVLFLTFLELLKVARAQLNDLTRRHLDFYYREALRMTSKKGVPDKVHALVELVSGQDQVLLPAGSLFKAGQDSLGKDLFYQSDEDLLANRASVESLRSLFSEKLIIGIRQAREIQNLLAELFPNNKSLSEQENASDAAFMAMLSMALGTPGPGSPLPPYPGNRTATTSLFNDLDRLLKFITSELYMPFSTFRSLMELKQQQAQSGGQWQRVNDILETAGKARDPNFQLDRSQPENFEKNLLAALDRPNFNKFFDGLPEVEDIYDLYHHIKRADVIEFIDKSLRMSAADFTTMMGIVEDINGRWRQIYEILRSAGRKKRDDVSGYKMGTVNIRSYSPDKFGELVQTTLGTITYPVIATMPLNNFDDSRREMDILENYFHVSAEEFEFIRTINQEERDKKAQPWEWEQVYAILERAHAEKEIIDRRNKLKEIKEGKGKGTGFEAMLLAALGDPNPGDPLPDSREFKSLDDKKDKTYISEQLFLEPANFLYIKTVQAKSSTPEEWAKVYAIVEQAQRRKRGLVDSRAEIEKWDNLYAAADATQLKVQLEAERGESTPRWRTFGEGFSSRGEPQHTPGMIGFAIASPLLALAEGARTITLTLDFQLEHFDKESIKLALQMPSPFRVLLSGEKEMVPVQDVTIKLLDAPLTIPGTATPYERALQITLTLDEQAPPVAPLTVAPLIQTPWPVLQILLTDIPATIPPGKTKPTKGPVKRYRPFQHLALSKIHLGVEAKHITTLTLQNDDGLIDPKKPFEPFGISPVAGSSFYIAHPELSSKRLDKLNMDIDWLGAPDDLNAYYLGYKNYADPEADPASPIDDNTTFRASLKLYDNRSLFNISNVQLFNATADNKKKGATQTNALTIGGEAITKAYPAYRWDLHPIIAPETLDWRRYWQLELLSPDFQHSLYARAAVGGANKIEKGSSPAKAKPFVVNPPYTPKIKRISMGYSASLEINLVKTDLNTQPDRLYHIEPFGYRDVAGYLPPPTSITPTTPPTPIFFLPQYDNEGELFIGIKNLSAPQDVSLLFQMAEGSANPDLAREKIEWTFLNGNRWRSLEEGQMLSDSTNGLLNSGIIKFRLEPVQPGTLLPPNLHWIRAAIARNSRSIGDTVAIQAQAVSATFVDHENAPDHLSQPLKAGSITGLAEPNPKIQTISQPYSSFGGKSPEQASSFYVRASERLRHKNRALTCWDYEHLVLEAFPGIFKVKCLPVGASEDPRLADVIQVIVIPDIKGKLPFDPFEPKAPSDVLFQIEQHLASQCAPFAQFKVKNPTYLRLKVRLGVRLRPEANPGYYKSLLNEELQRYLAPWAYDRSAEIVFGGEINTSLIVNFVEKRPYVDYVAGVKLFIGPNDNDLKPYIEGSVFTPDAIIVSDRSHEIDLITEEGYEEQFFTGINYMKIELDFQVATT